MKILVTGSHGTLGSQLCKILKAMGHEVTGWDRAHIPTDHYEMMDAYIRGVAPDILFHLAIASALPNNAKEDASWKVNYEWTSELAWICRQQQITFVFTSTALVFSNDMMGPFSIESYPDASSGYGFEKRMAESQVFAQNPNSRVVRLGWQIGETVGSNNMMDFLESAMTNQGKIHASRQWLPACSFLADTALALWQASQLPSGLYMADSNKHWNFYQIVQALAQKHEKQWVIEATDDYIYDQRMIDSRISMPALNHHLPSLL